MTQIILHYFDGRARAELARLILVTGKIEFNDHRIPIEEWPKHKASAPTGQLPYLEVNGSLIPQSIALSRYLAKLTNIDGLDTIEQAKADAIVDTCNDMMNSYYPNVARAENYQAAYENFLKNEAANCLIQLEKLVVLYGQDGYSVGSNLSWADLFIFEICSQLLKNNEAYLNKYPYVRKVCAQVGSNRRIAEYVKNRKQTPF